MFERNPLYRCVGILRSLRLLIGVVAVSAIPARLAAQLIITNPTGTVYVHPNKPSYSVSFTVDNETVRPDPGG